MIQWWFLLEETKSAFHGWVFQLYVAKFYLLNLDLHFFNGSNVKIAYIFHSHFIYINIPNVNFICKTTSVSTKGLKSVLAKLLDMMWGPLLNTIIPPISGKYGLRNHFWSLESGFLMRKREENDFFSKICNNSILRFTYLKSAQNFWLFCISTFFGLLQAR